MSYPSPPPSYIAIPNPYHSSQESSDSSPSSQGSSTKEFISRFGSPASDYSQTSYGSDHEPKTTSLSSQLDFSPNPCQASVRAGSIDTTPLPGFTVRKAATFPVHGQQHEAPIAREVPLSNTLQTRRTFPFQPPTLTRSSDIKEQFVNNLVGTYRTRANRKAAFLTSVLDSAKILVEVIWPLAASPRHSLSLKTYIQEILKRTKTSFSTLQVALYYLLMIKDRVPATDFTMEQNQDISSIKGLMCGRRMFLTAIILSSKYLQDKNFSSKAWSKITSLSVREINANELQFLREVGWKLHVPEAKFNKWQNLLIDYSKPMFTAQWKLAVEHLTPDLENLPPLTPSLGLPTPPLSMGESPMMSPPAGSSPPFTAQDIRAGTPTLSARPDGYEAMSKPPCPFQKGAVKGLNAMLSAWNLCKESTSSRCLLDKRSRPSFVSSRHLPLPHSTTTTTSMRNFSPTAGTLVADSSTTYSGQTYSTYSQATTPSTPTKPLIVDAFTHSPSPLTLSPETAVLSKKRHRQSFDHHSYFNPSPVDKEFCSPAATHARGLLRAAAAPEVYSYPLTVGAGNNGSIDGYAGDSYHNRGNGNACQRISRFLGCSEQAQMSRPFAKRVCSSLGGYPSTAQTLVGDDPQRWSDVKVR